MQRKSRTEPHTELPTTPQRSPALNTDDPHEIVHLNVGGTKFATTMATLQSQPGTLLSEMFSGRMSLRRDRDGNYFIDRDGQSFRHVLNFLRDGTLPPHGASDSMRREMKMEAAFYQIPQLLRWAQGSDSITGQAHSAADRVLDAYHGSAHRLLDAVYGRKAGTLTQEIVEHLVVRAGQGETVATLILYRRIDGSRDLLVPKALCGSLDTESSRRVSLEELPSPSPSFEASLEVLVGCLEEVGFPCQMQDDGRLLVDVQHTRPAARDTPERSASADTTLLLRDIRCTTDSLLDHIRTIGRSLLSS